MGVKQNRNMSSGDQAVSRDSQKDNPAGQKKLQVMLEIKRDEIYFSDHHSLIFTPVGHNGARVSGLHL